jgi:RHS repeat-associated protein
MGMERDGETGLDYFGARYMSSAQGRFSNPDPKQLPHEITDPQRWNKYASTRNNPLKYVDPNGQDWTLAELWEGARAFVRSYFEDAIEASRNNYVPQPLAPSMPGIPTMPEIAKSEVEAMAKETNLIAGAVSLIDPTGIGSATRSALSGDVKGTVMAMAVLGVPSGSAGKIALSEAKQLIGRWSQGTFEKIGASIAYHFEKHGAEVGAESVWQYLRKAEGFAGNLKGASKTVLEDGATRYTKNGRYIIFDENTKILSYGTVN